MSLWLFCALFFLSLFAELLANDKPILVMYEGELLFPIAVSYAEDETFGGALESEADYTDPWVIHEIQSKGWVVHPLLPYHHTTIDYGIARAPSSPSATHPLGVDDQGRDVLARVIYGFRISILFALTLTIFASIIGIFMGAVQGYFGGWTDLILQRFMEIWGGMPVLYLLIILASIIEPNFWWLLGLMLLFSWMSLVDLVRAEFLRARNFEYVKAARALGVREWMIMWRHVLPNALVSVFTFMPFILNGAITTLTSLDFLGFGLPPGSPSLGELLAQGKNNPQAPYLGITAFCVLALMLSLLIFIGEAVRDAFNPRKVLV